MCISEVPSGSAMVRVKEVSEDTQLTTELSSAGTKLVVVDFTASWCGPCKRIAPFVEEMAAKYSEAVFLKVDVDICPETAAAYSVSAMPTFILFKGGEEVEKLQGADQHGLEDRIKKHYGGEVEGCEEVRGMVDLCGMIDISKSEALNESDFHTFQSCLSRGQTFLQSDCDEQIIIGVTFNQGVRVHSIKIKAPADKGPKTIRLFINQPHTLDFDKASSMTATQELSVTGEQLQGSVIPLKFLNFQNVQNINVFIKDNQEGGEITRVEYLGFIGTPIATTNMQEFKRVSGNVGESGH